ncbi:MAG: hypothetical protein RSD28_07040 [Lachnospiraceae bacterium]
MDSFSYFNENGVTHDESCIYAIVNMNGITWNDRKNRNYQNLNGVTYQENCVYSLLDMCGKTE